MDTIEIIIEILELSVKKNGEIPLTNKHLLNIMKMAIRREAEIDFQLDMEAAKVDAGF